MVASELSDHRHIGEIFDPDSREVEEVIELLKLELAEVRASDDRADRKSQILFAFTGVTLAVSITTLGKWTGGPIVYTAAVVYAYVSVFFLSSAALLLALLVRPQLDGPAAKCSWNRLIAKPSSGEEAVKRVNCETPHEKAVRLGKMIYHIGVRARRKHRKIQWALVAMVIGSALLGAATISG